MKWLRIAGASLGAAALALAAQAAGTPAPQEFAWRGTLELPAGATAARVDLPAEALLRLQSSDLRDLRVFNAGGEAVAFALRSRNAGKDDAPAVRTPVYNAYPLQAPAPGRTPAAGAVQVRIDAPGGPREVWVQMGGAASAAGDAAAALPSAIFATQKEKQPLRALSVQVELPPNVPVQVTAAVSTDLAQWTPVAVRGRLYRFDGSNAPANDVLEFESPLQLEGRYLRLDWSGHDAVRVSALTGIVAQPAPAAPRVRTALPAPVATGKDTLDWTFDFATPLAALSLSSTRANTLLPVRVLGRNDAAQPWRELGQTVVYRLGAAGAETSNLPLALGSASVRQLRVVAGNGMAIDAGQLAAAVEFAPWQVVFLAAGSAPYQLVAGRADTPQASLGTAMLGGVLSGNLDDLPMARVVSVVQLPAGSGAKLLGFIPAGMFGTSGVLWVVLGAGVLVLAGVALALLRQLQAAPRPPAGTPPGP